VEILAILALSFYTGMLMAGSGALQRPKQEGPVLIVPSDEPQGDVRQVFSLGEARQALLRDPSSPVKCIQRLEGGQRRSTLAFTMMDAVDFFAPGPPIR
jgi:hypothetical protein